MTATSGSFCDWLCREVRDVLTHKTTPPPLLVWCDPDRAWLDLLREGARVTGFELWAPESGKDDEHELLVRDRFYSTPRAPRVVWFPYARDLISWFKPFELEAEQIWEKSLLQALREYGVDISREHEAGLVGILPAHAREWFDKPKSTWNELTPGNAKGTLVDDSRMLQVLAGPTGEFGRLQEEGRFDIFCRRASEDFGLPAPKDQEEAWRTAATARLLCTDAAEGSAHEQPREPDKIIPPGLPRTRALNLLRQWQHDIRYIPSFERLVPAAEATIGLTYWARNLTSPPRSRSSRAVEETLFGLTVDKLDRLEEVDVLATELEKNIQSFKDRENGFWGKEATKKVGWRFLVELADVAALIVENHATEKQWKSLVEAVDWYAERGWQLDQAGEQLFKESADLPKELIRIRARLRRGYLRTTDRIGRAFSELLAKAPEKIYEQLPTIGELALDEITRQTAPTALLFLDACRFDLGQRLAGLLNQGEVVQRAKVHTAVAPLPSITAIGMAFALPIKRKQLHVALSEDEKTFCVTADGFSGDLKWAEQRRKWMKDTLDIKDCLGIAEVLDGESLKKPGRSRRLIAVHGDELDSHDGQLKLTGADDHLRRYLQVIYKLRDAGYSRVIVLTDHGFFHWQPDEHEIEEQLPSGEVLWKHRRAIVGTGLSHPTAIRFNVPQSDLEVVVPRSTNAFRTYGGLGFFHGGATMQEMVIPVVVASWPAKARKVSVVLKPVGYIASEAPRIQLQAATTGQLFNADVNVLSRRVLVKVKDLSSGKLIFKHAEPVAVEPEGTVVNTVQLSLVEPRPELSFGTRLVVEVLDADDEESLQREEVELKIELSDW